MKLLVTKSIRMYIHLHKSISNKCNMRNSYTESKISFKYTCCIINIVTTKVTQYVLVLLSNLSLYLLFSISDSIIYGPHSYGIRLSAFANNFSDC